jgi:hypothetical protein
MRSDGFHQVLGQVLAQVTGAQRGEQVDEQPLLHCLPVERRFLAEVG